MDVGGGELAALEGMREVLPHQISELLALRLIHNRASC